MGLLYLFVLAVAAANYLWHANPILLFSLVTIALVAFVACVECCTSVRTSIRRIYLHGIDNEVHKRAISRLRIGIFNPRPAFGLNLDPMEVLVQMTPVQSPVTNTPALTFPAPAATVGDSIAAVYSPGPLHLHGSQVSEHVSVIEESVAQETVVATNHQATDDSTRT
ncbi:hypothetical protein BDB00DRAFT_868860 [Zychaea mexicana]|uniref:uncharacterized protein n=1 Tax=Zychaea mexicana TaxID=64656 RepID=UPI0022FDC8FE|nr:uncharacterized protein BDB00DRAFT_868860 [Zychaea mexicana]KAI9497026.1 hypothetical protein BDB00DRAFT_868860 [Zychaea mexicana]